LTAWYIYRGGDAKGELHARFDHDAAPLAGRPEYEIQVGLAVPLLDPGPDGLPLDDELPALDAIERVVVEHAGDRAVLVGVISTGGVREFVLYTGDGQWLEEFQGAVSAAVETHEIQMMARRDPEWLVYRAFVKT
jgi:uncharacterized protein DUF695